MTLAQWYFSIQLFNHSYIFRDHPILDMLSNTVWNFVCHKLQIYVPQGWFPSTKGFFPTAVHAPGLVWPHIGINTVRAESQTGHSGCTKPSSLPNNMCDQTAEPMKAPPRPCRLAHFVALWCGLDSLNRIELAVQSTSSLYSVLVRGPVNS